MLERILVIPDTHVPFENRTSWALMLKAAKTFKPHIIIHLGDFLDAYSLSKFAKDPNRVNMLKDEIKAGNKLLDQLDKLGAKKKYFLEGNHELRLQTLIQTNAPALDGLVSIPQLLKLKERGWKFRPYRTHIKIGHFYFTHDFGMSGKNSVSKGIDAYGGNICFGHTHRLGAIYSGNIKGETHLSLNLGWLGDPNAAEYAHQSTKRDWIQSFGIGYLNASNGNVYLQAVPIINKTVCLNGKLIKI